MNRFFSLAALLILLGVSSCQAGAAGELSLGDPESCSGVTVVVNFGILSEDSLKQCVVVGDGPAVAHEILSTARESLADEPPAPKVTEMNSGLARAR